MIERHDDALEKKWRASGGVSWRKRGFADIRRRGRGDSLQLTHAAKRDFHDRVPTHGGTLWAQLFSGAVRSDHGADQ